MGESVRVSSLSELEDGVGRRVDLGEHHIALFRIGDGVFAIGDRCSHADESLAPGEVSPADLTVECPRHASTFDLRTGEPLTLPATRPVPVYEVVIEGDDVSVVLP